MSRVPLPESTIRKLVESGHGLTDIGRILKAHPRSIWNACKRYGIPAPPLLPAPREKAVRGLSRSFAEIMEGVRYEDDPRACLPVSRMVLARPFEWRTLG